MTQIRFQSSNRATSSIWYKVSKTKAVAMEARIKFMPTKILDIFSNGGH